MPRASTTFKPTNFPNGIAVGSKITVNNGDQVLASEKVTVTITDGAGSGTYTVPTGAYVSSIQIETPTTIPGTPTNTNLRIGSSANGQQYVADVDVKTQGVITSTLLYAGRNPSGTIYYTVASSGGTAASQDGVVYLRVHYTV